MANTYKHGAYAYIDTTVAQSTVQAGTVPVYIGLAPINLVKNYGDIGGINKPIKLNNFIDAQKKLGYSDNWEKFTLCMPMAAHFDNPSGNIGPIYVINVLDPAVHKKSAATEATLTFTNGRAEFLSDTIILDTFTIDELEENTDYTLDYNYTKNSAIVTSLETEAAKAALTGSVAASYYEIDTANIDKDTIIGGTTAAGECSGIGAIKLLYQEQNQVPNLLAAPGFSHIPEVYNALCSASQKINGHWEAFVMADIPLKSATGDKVDTITKAQNWRVSSGFTIERSKVFWPQGIDNTGRIYLGSVLGMVEQLRADFEHDSVPMETCSNKSINIIKQYFGPDSNNSGFDQQEANELNAKGISTFVYWGGNWNLWGPHTAAYSYGADVDARAIFDVNIRMLMYIVNSFQREWSTTIDKPAVPKTTIQRIMNKEQEKLDGLVSRGALIGSPKILFLPSENSTPDLMNGDFKWNISATPTPPLKSATAAVSYTDEGFSAYFETASEED